MSEETLDDFTKAYIQAALWSSSANVGLCDECGEKVISSDARDCPHCGARRSVEGYDLSFQDREYGINSLAPATLATIKADCARFQQEQTKPLETATCARGGDWSDSEQAGHDFWLTRNGHGAGFWDGDWSEPEATMLDDASNGFGECNLYLGDDNLIYC